jgi:hypothetical protein
MYIQAKVKMAEIYLNHKRDRKAYARCYSELFERHKTVESCILLGEAYLSIQEVCFISYKKFTCNIVW